MNRITTEVRPTLAASEDDVVAISPAQQEKIEQAAEGFEAMFIKEMLSQMRKATQTLAGPDSIFASSINTDMLDMADSAIATQMAKSRNFGISDVLLRQLLPQNSAAEFKEVVSPVASLTGEAANTGQMAAFAMPVHRPFRQ